MKKFCYFYALLFILLSGACKKSDTSQPAPAPINNTAVTISSSPRVTGKIDGANYSRVEDGTTVADGYGSSLNLVTNPDTSRGSWSSYLTNDAQTVTYFQVSKGTLHFMGNRPTNTNFKALFAPAGYSYSPGSLNGVVITWIDGSGDIWSTDQGTMDQTGSSFVITDYKAATIYGDYVVKIKANFNCKLYNSSGQVKTFTNGLYIGNFANI